MSKRAAVILLTAIAVCGAVAQVRQPEFEVASVRLNRLDDRIVRVNVGPGNRFSARGYTLGLLIQRAYGVMGWNISGGPEWVHTDRWDVTAKGNTTGNLTESQLQQMLQRLLAERFRLRLHKESKEVAGYAMTVARGGVRMQAAAIPAETPDTFRMRNGELSGEGIALEHFAQWVGGKLYTILADQTGLRGFYNFSAKWTEPPDESGGGIADVDSRDERRAGAFAALQSQLGLKISAQKVSIETLVIDGVERASEN